MVTALRTSKRLAVVWLGLLAATFASSLVFESGHGRYWATVMLLVIAGVKILLIMGEFIELRVAPYPLALACATWVVVVATVLVIGFGIV